MSGTMSRLLTGVAIGMTSAAVLVFVGDGLAGRNPYWFVPATIDALLCAANVWIAARYIAEDRR